MAAPIMRAGLRSAGTIAYPVPAPAAGGNTRSPVFLISVPRRYLKRIWVWLTGTLTVTGGTGVGTILPDNIANLIAKLELYVDGIPYKVGAGAAFFRIGQRFDQTSGVNQGVVSKAAGASNAFRCLIPVSLEAMSTVNPADTLLDGRGVQNLQFFVSWNDPTAVIKGNDGVLAMVNTQVEIFVEDTEPFPIKAPFWIFREVETVQSPIVQSLQTRLILPVTPGAVLRSILIGAFDTGAGGQPVPVDTLLNQVTIRVNGADKPLDTLDINFIRARAEHVFGNPTILPVGWYHLELAEHGKVATTGLGARLGAAAINALDLIFNTNAPVGLGSIVAHTVEHVPPGVIAKAA